MVTIKLHKLSDYLWLYVCFCASECVWGGYLFEMREIDVAAGKLNRPNARLLGRQCMWHRGVDISTKIKISQKRDNKKQRSAWNKAGLSDSG